MDPMNSYPSSSSFPSNHHHVRFPVSSHSPSPPGLGTRRRPHVRRRRCWDPFGAYCLVAGLVACPGACRASSCCPLGSPHAPCPAPSRGEGQGKGEGPCSPSCPQTVVCGCGFGCRCPCCPHARSASPGQRGPLSPRCLHC